MNSNSAWLVTITLLLASIVFCFPCFNDTANIMDDMPFHLGRIRSITANLRAGNLLPTVYGDAANNFGYAAAFFYPDLLLYIPAFLALSGFELIRAYQIFIILITIATAATMYFATKRMLSNLQTCHCYKRHPGHCLTVEQALALLATIFYLAFPYRLINIYLRGALGEILAFTFLPIVFCGLSEIFFARKNSWKLLTFGMAGLLYSHIISSLMVSISILLIIAFNLRSAWQLKFAFLKAGIVAAFLGAAFLLPLIEQMQSNQFYYNVKNPFGSLSEQAIVVIAMPTPLTLLMTNITTVSILCFLYIWLKKREWYPKITMLLFATIYLILMTSNLFPWFLFENIPLFKHIQFPWRILLFVSYFASLLCALVSLYFLSSRPAFWYFSLATIAIIAGISFTNVLIHLSSEHKKPINYTPPAISVGRGEYLPAKIKFAGLARQLATPTIIVGEVTTDSYAKSGNIAEFIFSNASSKLSLEFPVIYYKGYTASLNNKPLPVTESKNGLIQIAIHETDSGRLIINYEHTWIQIIAYIISLTTALYLAVTNFRQQAAEISPGSLKSEVIV